MHLVVSNSKAIKKPYVKIGIGLLLDTSIIMFAELSYVHGSLLA